MQRRTNGRLVWYTFDLLEDFPHVVHGVFTRHGGVSAGDFSALNLGLSQGDLPENVEKNRKCIQDALGVPFLCSLWQHHGKQVVKANPKNKLPADAQTTNQKGLGLMILHADCQAAIFYDPIHNALSNVHCGWKGNVQNIYRETIETMKALYGSRPEELLVCISPSLGPQASEFINFKTELPKSFYPFQFKPTYFNLWEISRWQLLEAGILPSHIEISETCTYTHTEDFFSYRRLKASGRNATVALIT